MLSSRFFQNLLVGFIALMLGLGVLWATVAGARAGKSKVILQNAAAIKQGVQYFFNDQNRYPTALEFQDRNLMLNYFTSFPPPAIAGGPCVQTYDYASATARTFELNFCLPKAASGYPSGWNKLTQ